MGRAYALALVVSFLPLGNVHEVGNCFLDGALIFFFCLFLSVLVFNLFLWLLLLWVCVCRERVRFFALRWVAEAVMSEGIGKVPILAIKVRIRDFSTGSLSCTAGPPLENVEIVIQDERMSRICIAESMSIRKIH